MHGLRVGDNYGWMTKGTLGCHDCLLLGAWPIFECVDEGGYADIEKRGYLYQLCLFLFNF